MGRIFPIPAISTIANTLRASNDYIKGIGGLEEIPAVRIPYIDFSKDVIVIWVPGTNDRKIPAKFENFVHEFFPNSGVFMADYTASWNFSISIPHGVFTLAATLDYIKRHKRKGTKVYVAGQSQGALIAGEVMSKPEYAGVVDRTVLFSHPGISKHHYGGPNTKVAEFNNKFDFTTFNWGENDKEREEIVKALDSFMTGDITKALYLLKIGIKNPISTAWMGLSSLRLLPIPFLQDIPSFHGVTELDYSTAVGYLKYGSEVWKKKT